MSTREDIVNFFFGPPIPKIVKDIPRYAKDRKETFDQYNKGLETPASAVHPVAIMDRTPTPFEYGRIVKGIAPGSKAAVMNKQPEGYGAAGTIGYWKPANEKEQAMMHISPYSTANQLVTTTAHELGHAFEDRQEYRHTQADTEDELTNYKKFSTALNPSANDTDREPTYSEMTANRVGLALNDPNKSRSEDSFIPQYIQGAMRNGKLNEVYDLRGEEEKINFWSNVLNALSGTKEK